MKQDLSAFRITLLLYVGVLLVPLGFFYTYNSVRSSSDTVDIVRKLGHINTDMALFLDAVSKEKETTVRRIGMTMEEIDAWVRKNDGSEFYVGGKTLQKDMNDLKQCWQNLRNAPQRSKVLQCIKKGNSLSFTIDKMYTLQQSKIRNLFYLGLLGTVILLLLLIYFVRVYMHIQRKKHAIHDHDTHLFNKKYFLTELHTAVERAKREKTPLSLLSVSINNFGDEGTSSKNRKHLVKQAAHLLSTLTRESDVVSRYDTGHFLVLMEHTDKGNALHLLDRVKKAFSSHEFHTELELEFSFNTVQFDSTDTEQTFLKRGIEDQNKI